MAAKKRVLVAYSDYFPRPAQPVVASSVGRNQRHSPKEAMMTLITTLAVQLPILAVVVVTVVLVLVVVLAGLALLPGPTGRRSLRVLNTLLRAPKRK